MEKAQFEEEYELDSASGSYEKKGKTLDLLNRKKVSRWELDELFLED